MIIPAIIPSSLQNITDVFALLPNADTFQVDFVDGEFAGEPSWPFTLKDWKVGLGTAEADRVLCETNRPLEFDLMIQNPEESLNLFLAHKPTQIMVHFRSVSDWTKLRQIISDNPQAAWNLAVMPTESIMEITPYLEMFNGVQVMGIDIIGLQGQAPSLHTAALTSQIRAASPDKPITIDGAVNQSRLAPLFIAGARRFVVGSALLRADNPAEAYMQFSQYLAQLKSESGV